MLGFVFRHTPAVQDGETDLESDQGVGARVPAPSDPKDVAEEEEPEAPLASAFFKRRDEVCRDQRHYHRRPLNVIDPVHPTLNGRGAGVARTGVRER